MAWFVEVYAASVECVDTESITSDDIFAASGSVLVDGRSHGFITPVMAVGPGETHDMGGYPTGPGELYRGWSDDPRVGFIVRGYDIDDNEQWVRNRETIKKVVEAIEKITDDIPVVGDIVSVAAKIPHVIDVFVDADEDDIVLGHTSWIDLTVGPPERAVTEWRIIRTRRGDETGYSSSDYTLHLRIVHRQAAGSLGDRPIPRLRPHRGSDLDDWTGIWQGPHVDCAISHATSALGTRDVLTVQITEQVDGRTTQIRERAVRINQPFLRETVTGPNEIPTSRLPEENQGGGLIGSATVEGRGAGEGSGPVSSTGGLRTERDDRGGASVAEPVVDVLARSAGGPWVRAPTICRSIRTWCSSSTRNGSAEKWLAPGCATSDLRRSQHAPALPSWTRCWRPASSDAVRDRPGRCQQICGSGRAAETLTRVSAGQGVCLEPPVGVEPTTYSLRVNRSTD